MVKSSNNNVSSKTTGMKPLVAQAKRGVAEKLSGDFKRFTSKAIINEIKDNPR